VFKTRKANIGIMLCYDRHFPESARLYGQGLADILFVASATPKSAAGPWFFEQQAHAFSNCFALVCSNRSGTEDNIEFLGSSFMCDHKGKVVEAAEETGDRIISCEIDIGEIRKAKKELAFFHDRRPSLYGAISKDE
jgi:N-carbamoylputrescine amidase